MNSLALALAAICGISAVCGRRLPSVAAGLALNGMFRFRLLFHRGMFSGRRVAGLRIRINCGIFTRIPNLTGRFRKGSPKRQDTEASDREIETHHLHPHLVSLLQWNGCRRTGMCRAT